MTQAIFKPLKWQKGFWENPKAKILCIPPQRLMLARRLEVYVTKCCPDFIIVDEWADTRQQDSQPKEKI